MMPASFTVWVACLGVAFGAAPSGMAAPPSSAKALLSESILWGYVPDLPASVARLQGSALAGLARQPLRQRGEALIASGVAALLWSWSASSEGPGSDTRPQAARLQLQGGERLEPAALPAAAAQLVQRRPAPDLVGQLDVQRAYDWLVRQPGGSRRVQILRRLGFERATRITLSAQLDGAVGGWAEASLAMPPNSYGMSAALGPPVPVQRPEWLGPPASAFATVSVLPSRVWLAAERVAGGLWPVEYSLWLLHLEALEKQLNKSFLSEVLGEAPRLWTVVARPAGSGPAPHSATLALVAEVADGPAARRFVEAMTAVARGLAPDLEVEDERIAGTSAIMMRGGHGHGRWQACMAFLPHHILLASSPAAMGEPLRALSTAVQGGRPARAGGDATEERRPRAIAFGETPGSSTGQAEAFVRALGLLPVPQRGPRPRRDGGDGRAGRGAPFGEGPWHVTSQLNAAPGGYRLTARLRLQ